jgi:hypothetical protein
LNALRLELGDSTLDYVTWLFNANKLDLHQCILTGKVGEKNLGKWLSHSHIPEAAVSKICAAKKSGTPLTLTTRYKDFTRMSMSKHYDSCVSSLSTRTVAYYLHKSNVFMLVNRGANGDFRTRVIGRLLRLSTDDAWRHGLTSADRYAIVFNRIYGVDVALPNKIHDIPCFSQRQRHQDVRGFSHLSTSVAMQNIETRKSDYGWQENHVYDDLLHDLYVKKII